MRFCDACVTAVREGGGGITNIQWRPKNVARARDFVHAATDSCPHFTGRPNKLTFSSTVAAYPNLAAYCVPVQCEFVDPYLFGISAKGGIYRDGVILSDPIIIRLGDRPHTLNDKQ